MGYLKRLEELKYRVSHNPRFFKNQINNKSTNYLKRKFRSETRGMA